MMLLVSGQNPIWKIVFRLFQIT